MAEICVVHLIRAQNGIEPFKRFIESYTEYHGGIDHDLVIIFKGFTNREHIAEYRELLKSFSYKPLFVRDFGFDVRAYFSAVNTFDYKYFCFLNSYSYLLDQEWLKSYTPIYQKTAWTCWSNRLVRADIQTFLTDRVQMTINLLTDRL
jgi:hypothetical protein